MNANLQRPPVASSKPWRAMSRTAAGLALLAMLSAGGAFATTLQTEIDSVTVYPRGANVVRSVQVDLAAGSSTLLFGGLPAAIDRTNLRVAAPTTGVSVGQVDVTRIQRKDAFAAEVTALQTQIDAVRTRIRALDDATATAKLQLQFLDGIAQGYAKEAWLQGAQGNVNVASWQEALRVLGSGGDTARQRIRDNDANKRDAQQTLSLLERQLADLQGGQLAATTVSVRVASNTTQRAELRIEYFQNEASWSPTYEARLNSETGALQLQQNAKVQQTTAEPWNDVALQLSTNTPTGRLSAPVQRSEFLDLADERSAASIRSRRAMASS